MASHDDGTAHTDQLIKHRSLITPTHTVRIGTMELNKCENYYCCPDSRLSTATYNTLHSSTAEHSRRSHCDGVLCWFAWKTVPVLAGTQKSAYENMYHTGDARCSIFAGPQSHTTNGQTVWKTKGRRNEHAFNIGRDRDRATES